MAFYNTVPAEDTRLQEAPKSWKLKKIVVVSAALVDFHTGQCNHATRPSADLHRLRLGALL